ncbi:MAG: serine/threonine-protein kinase, partial [Vicinamibacteria bacterium]
MPPGGPVDSSAFSIQDLLREILGERYAVREEIGDGGFGQVFEVFDRHMNTTVAAKVLRPELLGEEGGAERFLREIRLLCELRHPNIIPILDYLRSERLIAYLMPLIAGPTLRQRLDSVGALSLDESVRLVAEVGGALDFAHRRGVFHRDLKPQNILLSDGHAVLADFGIARSLAGEDSRTLTQTGVIVGSPRYMSPEQLVGGDRLDGRSDLYALATITYELLAGHPPFGAASGDGLHRQKLLAAPASLRIGRPSVPASLDEAILRGLAPNPADRQATVGAFVRECEEALRASGGIRATTAVDIPTTEMTTPRGTAPRPVSRGVLAGAAVLVVALGAYFGWSLQSRQAHSREDSLPEVRRAWFVLEDVETTPPDPNTAEAVRAILQSHFEQSKVMGVLTRDEVTGVLLSAAKPESSIVRDALAREIAVRAGARGLITASIRRSSDGIVIGVRAIDLKRDSILVSIGRTVSTGSALLPQVEKLAAELRKVLEPQASNLASYKGNFTTTTTVTTADFQAYQLMLLGGEAAAAGNDREAAFFMRQAL